MAEGMEVDQVPAVRDKKRFEVKKVSAYGSPMKRDRDNPLSPTCSLPPSPFLSLLHTVECCCSVGMG